MGYLSHPSPQVPGIFVEDGAERTQEPEMVANSKGTVFSRHGREAINMNSTIVTACNRLVQAQQNPSMKRETWA